VVNQELERSIKELKLKGVNVAILSAPYNVAYITGFSEPIKAGALDHLSAGPVIAVAGVSFPGTILVIPESYKAIAEKNARCNDIYCYPLMDHFKEIDSMSLYY